MGLPIKLEYVSVKISEWGIGAGEVFEIWEMPPYEIYERGGERFRTADEAIAFLQEQAVLHRKVAAEYEQAATQMMLTFQE